MGLRNLRNIRNQVSAPRAAATQNVSAPATQVNQNVQANFAEAVEKQAGIIAERLVNERLAELRRVNTGRVFTRFDETNDVVANQKEVVTRGLWTGNTGTLWTFYTSSVQTSQQKQYYYEIWNSGSSECGAEPQFSVTWGNRQGSGSDFSGNDADSPSRAIYSQYRLLLLEPDDTTFTFANNTNSDNIYVINFNRARLRQKLDPGNWELWLAELNGADYTNAEYTGSGEQVGVSTANPGAYIKLIDDSGDTNEEKQGNAGRIHNVVSGSITDGVYKVNGTNPVYYGLSYPDMGMIVLNGDILDASASFNTVSSSDDDGNNAFKLYAAISGGGVFAEQSGEEDSGFLARNSETVTSTYYFCRVKNAEMNFSNNPTFVTGGLGEFSQPQFIGDPKVYITTVGLYNDRQELLAVAKLSQPIIKSFTNELTLRVKLDF
jgi:hypothetical protein